LKDFFKQITLRDIRNVVFGVTIVFGGLGLAFVTLYANQTGNASLAGAAAIASLVFVVLILLFVVPPLARGASREVAQIDLPIELTGGGLIFLGIVAIVAFAAWNTGNNLLFLVLSFLLATLTVSFLLAGANLKKLEAKVRFPEAIFGGEPTAFAVGLQNRKLTLPTFSVTLTLRGTMTENPFGGRKFLIRPPESLARFLRLSFVKKVVGYFIFVPRRGAAEQQTEQFFASRGRFIIKDFELSTKFPFGFWLRRKRLKVRETDIFIFPKPESVRDLLPKTARKAGQFTARRRGAGQDLIGLRDYQASDDIRRVDWNATARTGNLIVREFLAEDERRITVWFDTHLSEKESEETKARFERGVSIAAGVAAHFINEKAQIRFAIPNRQSDFGADKAHLYKILRQLAIVEPHFEKTLEYEFDDASDFLILITANKAKIENSNRFLVLRF
jgi:uncharacterized protein (DUF58 family)